MHFGIKEYMSILYVLKVRTIYFNSQYVKYP